MLEDHRHLINVNLVITQTKVRAWIYGRAGGGAQSFLAKRQTHLLRERKARSWNLTGGQKRSTRFCAILRTKKAESSISHTGNLLNINREKNVINSYNGRLFSHKEE